MNKLFSKSKKSQDKRLRQSKINEENDFLYGRSKASNLDLPSSMQSTRTNLGSSMGQTSSSSSPLLGKQKKAYIIAQSENAIDLWCIIDMGLQYNIFIN